MLKKTLTALTLMCACTAATAEIRPYANADFGISEPGDEYGFTYKLGAGLQFNEYVEVELAYNNFGESSAIKYTSYSAGINLGVPVADRARLYTILGAENLDREGSFATRTIDDSSTEAFYGVGASFDTQDNLEVRLRVVGHDSGRLLTATLGLAYYF